MYKLWAVAILSLTACGRTLSPAAMPSRAPISTAQIVANTPRDQEKFLPKPSPVPQKEPAPFTPGPAWTPASQSTFPVIRVKIFPHNSTYTQPEGPEASKAQVTFAPGVGCDVFAATSESSEGAAGAKLRSILPGSKFTYSAAALDKPEWLVCDGPVRMERLNEKIEPLHYAGKLFIKKVGSGDAAYLTVVNVLPLEEYVKGVVPSEMPSSWHPEALKAQVVAARTYVLYSLASHEADHDAAIQREKSGAQLDDTVGYQAYLGTSTQAPASNQAVQDTTGLVLTYNGSLVNAFFHDSSGGHTEDAANVWGVAIPYAVGKAEIFPDSMVKGGTWTVNASLAKVQSRLQAAGALGASAAALTAVSIPADGLFPSGRARTVNLAAGADIKGVSGGKFAHALDLRSNLIQVTSEGDSVKIQGSGFGHGVGMSQWGARIMAEHYRKSFEEILKFYYTGVEISGRR
ncbi:MAG: SpoIID/LytB domain-containing protein [Bdellovibrionota bacterium]